MSFEAFMSWFACAVLIGLYPFALYALIHFLGKVLRGKK